MSGRARPVLTLAPKPALEQHIDVRVSTTLYDAACRRALYEGLSLAELTRQALTAYVVGALPAREEAS